MIDRAAIDAAWSRIAHMLDPVHGDVEADALLRNRTIEQPGIEHALAHVELIERVDRGAITALGYGFVRDAQIWRRASEAVYQARALQQLAHWWTINPTDAPALGNVVVRHTFASSFAFGTPQHIVDRVAEPIHFVVIPIVYGELLMLAAKAFNTMLSGSEAADAWGAMLGESSADVATVPPAMKQLLARLLTDHAFHAVEPGDNPAARLRAQSDWFDWDEADREPGRLETHLSYAALDFAIAHELGHRILDLLAPATPDGSNLELAADLIGIRLFGASWGWRDDIFEGCPLSDGGRVLLGPIWFFFAARLLFTLQRLLGVRVQGIEPGAPLARARDKPQRHLELIVDRWTHQQDILAQYAEILTGFGADAAEGDRALLDRLITALQLFNDAVPKWVAEIPESDIRFASQLRAI